MWVEYLRSLFPKANIEFSETEKVPCVDMATKTIKIPRGFPEGQLTRAVVKHELAHLLFTEKSYDTVAKEEKLTINDADFDISNAIEDIRVEKRFGSDYIGVKQDFEELSKTIFSKITKLPLTLSGLGMITSFYLNFGTLPEHIEVDEKLLGFFNREKNDLYTKFLGLKDVNDSVLLAEEYLDKYEKEFGKLPERSQITSGKSKGGTGEQEQGETGEGSESGDSKKGEGDSEGGEEKEQVWGDDRIEKGTASIHELIKEYIKGKVSRHEFSSDCNHYSNCGNNIVLEKGKLEEKFVNLRSRDIQGCEGQVLKTRQVLLSWLTDEARNRTIRQMKSGKLSSRDLFKVKTQKEPKVFKKKIFGKSNTVDLEILIDHSGSMRGNTINTALDMGYVFNQALKSIKQVNYEITGFTTDGYYPTARFTLDNVYYVYKSFGSKANALTQKLLSKELGSGGRRQLCHNNDFEALNYAEKRLAKQGNDRKILFVISDGRPEVGYISSRTMNTITRDKIKELRKRSYEVYGFGIGVNLSDLYEQNFVKIDRVSELSSIVSSKLLKVMRK